MNECYAQAMDAAGICSVSNTAAIVWYSILAAGIVVPLVVGGAIAAWNRLRWGL
jgi:hypothetical protein